MTILHPDADRIAFVGYLRRGTPRGLSLKQAAETGRHVRHRRRNDRVRPAHRMNDGRTFSRSAPPDTGTARGRDEGALPAALPLEEHRKSVAQAPRLVRAPLHGRRAGSAAAGAFRAMTPRVAFALRQIG